MSGHSDSNLSLPTELHEYILDILDQNFEFVSLKACSLVNDIFRLLSQRRILKSITLRAHTPSGEGSYYSSVAYLAEDIERSPQISSYVHKLVLPCKWVLESHRNCSVWDYQILSKLLLDLPNLCLLSIQESQTFRHDSKGLYEWKGTFDSAIQTTLLNFFHHSTKLTDLDLTGIHGFPVVLLGRIPSLKRLSVSTINPLSLDNGNPTFVTRRLQLEYFGITYPNLPFIPAALPWLNSPLCPLDFQNLKTLKIAFKGQEYPHAERLCTLCPKVPHIYIDLMNASVYTSYNSLNYLLRTYPRESILDLQGFNALKRLTIEGVLKPRTFHHRILIDYFETPIPWITDMLAIISTSSRSATTFIELTLKLIFIDFQLSLIHHLHNNWIGLRSSLAARNLPNFARLNLQITGLPPLLLAKLKEDETLVEMQKDGRLVYL